MDIYQKIDCDIIDQYKINQILFVNVKDTKPFVIKEISGEKRKSYTVAIYDTLSPILIKKISEKRLKHLFVTNIDDRDKKRNISWDKFLIDNGCKIEYLFSSYNSDNDCCNTLPIPYAIRGDKIDIPACFIRVSYGSPWISLFVPGAYRSVSIKADDYFNDHCCLFEWTPPKIK